MQGFSENLKLPLPMKVRGRPKGLGLTVVGKRKKLRGDQNKMKNKRCKMDAVQRDELVEDVRGKEVQSKCLKTK